MQRKEIRVEARVRNNLLWHAIYDLWPSVIEFCRQKGFHATQIGPLLNLKMSPLNRRGEYSRLCQRIADILGFQVEELFPLALYRITRPQAVIELSMAELPAARQMAMLPAPGTPYTAVVDHEMRRAVSRALDTLPPRFKTVIERRFLKGQTLEEVGKELGVGPERVRQMEANALRKLRHPSRSRTLRSFIEQDPDDLIGEGNK